jgi:hypothetical protein
MATWSPPSYDPRRVGEFVASRYGRLSPARQRAIFNRLNRRGFEFGEDPSGLRTGLIRLTPQMTNRLPEGWGGEGVQNVGRARPQFDETRFEAAQNAAGRYFLRPLTEMSGLGPQQVAALRDMDTRTSAQQDLIRGSFASAADTAATEAQGLSARLAAIPGATGMTSAPSSTSASTGAGTDQRLQDIARSEQTLAATRASADAALRAPAIRQQGISAANDYGTQAQAARAQMMAGFRGSNAESAAAQESLNARLRSQDLNLLGVQLRTGGQISMNNADNARQLAVANAGNQQRERQSVRQLQARLADINSRLQIARQNNDAANVRLLTQQRVAQQKRLDRIAKDSLSYINLGSEDNPTNLRQRRSQYVQMLVRQDYPRAAAIRLANAYIK